MIRNEYRRAFIMLRAAMQGFSGHVRLERRTLTGAMYFIVAAPEGAGPLAAALAGQRDGQYYAVPLGELTQDRRGQLTLASQFDPRSIDGRPLEAYAWVAVADTGDSCRVALTGNVEGSREVDPAALERAVCALFAQSRSASNVPAADIPGPEAPPAQTRPDGRSDSELSASPAPDDSATASAAAESDVKIYTSSRARVFAAQSGNAAEIETAAVHDAPAVSANAEALPSPEEILALYAQPESTETDAAATEAEDGGEAECDAPQIAAQMPDLNITQPWPRAAEALRRLFATQAPTDAPLPGDYVYAKYSMPVGSGYESCLAGLRVENGQITGIRYALPGRYSAESPAGLEQYAWVSTDGSEGYWVLDIDVS
ncbi:MAG: hypothetical protein IJ769_03320 [Clostridia bacterium]|nr:hypothetical protein [Clostridia bacterium]